LALAGYECQPGPASHQERPVVPTYQYVCTNSEDKHEFEVVQSFSDPSVTECPQCGSPVRKVYGSVGVVFKGSGFYRTDSREATAAKGSSNGAAATKETSGDGSSSSSASTSGAASSGTSGTSTPSSTTKTADWPDPGSSRRQPTGRP
jgi:putative FmdB family regulatory protein